jgi:hypothetical protein
MIRLYAALLAIVASVPVHGQMGRECGRCSSEEALCEPIPGPAADCLCVASVEGEEAVWSLCSRDGRSHSLAAPQTSLLRVAEVRVSPSGRYVAIVSVGEGHPILDVVDLYAVLGGRGPEPLVSINPYPGTINVTGWDGEHLVVESDSPLDRPKEGEILDEAETFMVAVPSGVVTRR